MKFGITESNYKYVIFHSVTVFGFILGFKSLSALFGSPVHAIVGAAAGLLALIWGKYGELKGRAREKGSLKGDAYTHWSLIKEAVNTPWRFVLTFGATGCGYGLYALFDTFL